MRKDLKELKKELESRLEVLAKNGLKVRHYDSYMEGVMDGRKTKACLHKSYLAELRLPLLEKWHKLGSNALESYELKTVSYYFGY